MKLAINKEMLAGARKQFCLDIGMSFEDYEQNPYKKAYITKSKYKEGTTLPATAGARCYAGSDAFFWAIICMGQLFLSVDEQLYEWACKEFSDCAPEWFCEYDNLRRIDEKLREYGRKVGDTHVYFLPGEGTACETVQIGENDSDVGKNIPCEADIGQPLTAYQWYDREEILRFQEGNRFKSAICFSPTQPDVLAVAAIRPYTMLQSEAATSTAAGGKVPGELYAKGKEFNQAHMAGMAGVSEDGKYLWQIGINVDEDSTGQGLAARLVRMIKEEVIRRGKIPFYGTSESHIISQTVGIKAGFVPAFTTVYAKRQAED